MGINTGVPEPTAERLAELQKAKTDQTILGMKTDIPIPVSALPPDASGIVPTGQAATALVGQPYPTQAGTAYTTLIQGSQNQSERARDIARETSQKDSALKSMGFDPAQTTLDQFLAEPGREQIYRETINMFTYGIANPTFKTFSVGQDTVTTAKGAIQKLETYDKWATQQQAAPQIGGQPSAIETQMLDLIKGQITSNTAYNESLMVNLKAQSEADRKAREQINKATQGQSAWMLAKMGALGTTMSGQSYLLSVEEMGRDKIAALAAEYQSKIIEAQKAMNDGNYKLTAQAMDFAMQIQDRIDKEKQRQFENSLAIASEQRKQQEFNRQLVEWAQQDISNLVSIGYSPADFSEEDKRDYEAKAGYPAGMFDKLYNIVKSSQEVNSYAAQLELDKKKYDILKDVPQSVEISVGGRMESGLKMVAANVWEQIVTDANGNISLVTYDENTGEMKIHKTGVNSGARAGSSGGGGIPRGSIPTSGANLASVVQDLYYKATGTIIYDKNLAAAMGVFSQNTLNQTDKLKSAQSATLLQAAAKAGAHTPSGIQTDAQLYNSVVNGYYSNPTSNPFYKDPKISFVEGIDKEGQKYSSVTTTIN